MPTPFSMAANKMAVQLLRGRLSPEQLADFDRPRLDPRARGFNVVGSLGGKYTVWGIPEEQGCYGSAVGLGFEKMRADWCIHVFSQVGNSRPSQYGHMPAADQMLAFKLAIETDEAAFLLRGCPTTGHATSRRDHNADAIEQASLRNAI